MTSDIRGLLFLTPPHLQVEDGVLVHVLSGNDFLDDAVHQDLAHVLQLDVLVVLDGDDDRVHAAGNAGAVLERVFARDLCVRAWG